ATRGRPRRGGRRHRSRAGGGPDAWAAPRTGSSLRPLSAHGPPGGPAGDSLSHPDGRAAARFELLRPGRAHAQHRHGSGDGRGGADGGRGARRDAPVKDMYSGFKPGSTVTLRTVSRMGGDAGDQPPQESRMTLVNLTDKEVTIKNEMKIQ